MPEYRFTPILFTTELGGEELAAYREIKCYDFLIKPFTQEQFLRAVSTALDMGQQMKKPEPILRIEQKQFLFEYELKQIRYIESFGKRLVIHSISQGEDLADQISGYSLMRLLELAGKDNLIQCHKSFLINPVFIKKIDKAGKSDFIYAHRGERAPWDYRNYQIDIDNCLLKGEIARIKSAYENPEEDF